MAVTADARRTVRNAGWLMAQRALHFLTATAFAMLVPRLMGPEVFGQYSLLTSVSMWFAMLSGLGAVSLMTRAVPQLTSRGDTAGLGKLVTNLLALRASTGTLTALGYFLVIVLLAGELDRTAATLVAAAVFCRTVGNLCFSLFLGLNQAARWGLGDLTRRMLTLAGVLAGYPIAGLRGACAGFLAANLVVLIVGLIGARPFLQWSSLDLRRGYLAPFLRTGTSFAAGNLLLALAQRTGETVVRLGTGDYAEVGYFGAAYSAYLTGGQALWQGAIAFAPLLVATLHGGERGVVSGWLSRLLKWMAIVVSLAALATVFIAADAVPAMLGPAFVPVVPSLYPLALTLFALSVASIGRLGTLVADRPWLAASAAASELAVFWTVGLLLVPRHGSVGMAWAALSGTLTYATVITWRMRAVLPYSPRAAAQAVGLAAPFLPLALLRGDAGRNTALLAAAIAGYVVLLFWRRVVTPGELRSLRAFARREVSP